MKSMKIGLILGAVAVSGCSSMSGLDANSSFSCKAPDGVLCESMSGVYANAKANNLPGQRVGHRRAGAEPGQEQPESLGVLPKPITSGAPVRTAPVVLRVWLAPWEDSDGDLHDQSYIYLQIDNGRWLIEHNRRRIQDAYRPVRGPTVAPSATGSLNPKIKSAGPNGPSGDEVKPDASAAAEMLSSILKPANAGASEGE